MTEYGKYEQEVQNWSEMEEKFMPLYFSLYFPLNLISLTFFIAALFALKNREGAMKEGLLKCHPCFEKGKLCIFIFKISALKGT